MGEQNTPTVREVLTEEFKRNLYRSRFNYQEKIALNIPWNNVQTGALYGGIGGGVLGAAGTGLYRGLQARRQGVSGMNLAKTTGLSALKGGLVGGLGGSMVGAAGGLGYGLGTAKGLAQGTQQSAEATKTLQNKINQYQTDLDMSKSETQRALQDARSYERRMNEEMNKNFISNNQLGQQAATNTYFPPAQQQQQMAQPNLPPTAYSGMQQAANNGMQQAAQPRIQPTIQGSPQTAPQANPPTNQQNLIPPTRQQPGVMSRVYSYFGRK